MREKLIHAITSRVTTVLATLSVVVAATLLAASPASADGRPLFQLPFTCGQQWRFQTGTHYPAVDMFREPESATAGSLLVASASGVVNKSFTRGAPSGNVIQINHGGGWFSTYLHMESRSVVEGQRVIQGQAIGTVGNTGTGVPHLHYEQAIDRNGDGEAEWGHDNNERVAVLFNGIRYGTDDRQSWRFVASRNCRGAYTFVAGDWNSDGDGDIIARHNATGQMYFYRGDGSGRTPSKEAMPNGGGWTNFTFAYAGDFDGDGRSDLLGRDDTTGLLYVYKGDGARGFTSRFQCCGAGWGGCTFVAGSFTEDATPDILARDNATGRMWLYPGNGRGAITGKIEMPQGGGGWNPFSFAYGHSFGQGSRPDVLAVDNATGNMYVYHGNGFGDIIGRAQCCGVGWGGYTFTVSSDFNGDGTSDILARDNATGQMFLYPGNGVGGTTGKVFVGNGW